MADARLPHLSRQAEQYWSRVGCLKKQAVRPTSAQARPWPRSRSWFTETGATYIGRKRVMAKKKKAKKKSKT
jgi:hypothetical protein